jgi:hypothetical protein
MRYGTLAIFFVVVLASPAFAGSDYDDFTITKVTVSDGEILVIGTQESESSSACSICLAQGSWSSVKVRDSSLC